MKVKPLYLYAALVAIAIIVLIMLTPGTASKNSTPDDKAKNSVQQENENPAGLKESARQKSAELRQDYEQHPDDTLKARRYADFLSVHKPDQAVAIYDKILQKNSKRTDIRFTVALLYLNMEKFDKAEEYISSVLKYDKDNIMAKYNLGVAAALRGDKKRARNIWNDLISKNPGSEYAAMAKESLQSISK